MNKAPPSQEASRVVPHVEAKVQEAYKLFERLADQAPADHPGREHHIFASTMLMISNLVREFIKNYPDVDDEQLLHYLRVSGMRGLYQGRYPN